eukprot:718712_1
MDRCVLISCILKPNKYSLFTCTCCANDSGIHHPSSCTLYNSTPFHPLSHKHHVNPAFGSAAQIPFCRHTVNVSALSYAIAVKYVNDRHIPHHHPVQSLFHFLDGAHDLDPLDTPNES